MCFGEVVPLHWAGESLLPEGALQDLRIRRDGGLLGSANLEGAGMGMKLGRRLCSGKGYL